ncbi:MAG: DUF2779 domain-containing protein [Chitinivibrionales bacterium]|nr:DUF2779 domain-containing protein [Chitinivibrionales bacterium]
MSHRLSKSRYVAGIQCPKILWMGVNFPDEAAGIDPATRRIFDIGHRIGEHAQSLFPGGVLVNEPSDNLASAIRKTGELAGQGVPAIFEATVDYDKILCRIDIFKRVRGKKNLWDLYEVKSSNSVNKKKHYPDVAVQKYCCEGAGFPIRKAFLMHCNREYVRKGEIVPRELLVAEDITEEIEEDLKKVRQNAAGFLRIMAQKNEPAIEPGPHCSQPYICAYSDHCNKPGPEYAIGELCRAEKTIAQLEKMGITLLKDIPATVLLSDRNQAFVESVKRKKPVINKAGLHSFLEKLDYPLYHFDFETVSCAVPLFDNSRPWQNIPFQFSLHVQKKPCGPCAHHEFLPSDRSDPRERLIQAMQKHLGDTGSIVAFNQSFEIRCIQSMADDFPKYRKWLLSLIPRMRDLIVPFRNGHYAHHKMHGSASLKYVLPALAPKLSYNELEIQEGTTASLQAELWYDNQIDGKEWKQVYAALQEYCKLDTLAMVEILRVLYVVSSN